MTHPLDNVVWHALQGEQRALGEHRGRAARFDPEVAVFGALAEPTAEAWDDFASLVDPVGVLFAPSIEVPDAWRTDAVMPCLQMIATDVVIEPVDAAFEPLGADDVPDVLSLVEATKPGPVGKRTIEMGRYIGLREHGQLVAMAGERFKVPGYTEVSLVCTAEEVRGRGLGRQAVMAVVDRIRARGEEAFLHVLTDNAPAIELYRAMGFTVRTEASAYIVRKPR
jgi:predicted GNAT family acetyltransferase